MTRFGVVDTPDEIGDPADAFQTGILSYSSLRVTKPYPELAVQVDPGEIWLQQTAEAVSDYSNEIVRMGSLRSYWRFTEAKGAPSIFDVKSFRVGTPLGGILLGESSLIENDIGNGATLLDGVDGRISVGNVYGFNDQAPFSLECWLRVTGEAVANRTVVSKAPGWFLQVTGGSGTSADRIRFVRQGLSEDRTFGTAGEVISTYQISYNTTYHVVCTYDGVTQRLYINGVLNRVEVSPVRIVGGAGTFEIGSYGGTQLFFNGKLDELAVYGLALPPETVAKHTEIGRAPGAITTPPLTAGDYKRTVLATSGLEFYFPLDDTKQVNASTSATDVKGGRVLTGGAITVVDSLLTSVPKSKAWKFDLVESRVVGSVSTPPGAFSFECWIKLDRTTTNGIAENYLRVHRHPTTGRYTECGFKISTTEFGQVRFERKRADQQPDDGDRVVWTTWSDVLVSNVSLARGVRHHVVCTYDLATMRIFINGTLDSSRASLIRWDSYPSVLRLGFLSPYGNGTDGSTFHCGTPSDADTARGVSSGGGFFVGFWTTNYGFGLKGDMDEPAYYTKALSATQVQDHYEQGQRPTYQILIEDVPSIAHYWTLDEPAGATVAAASIGGVNGSARAVSFSQASLLETKSLGSLLSSAQSYSGLSLSSAVSAFPAREAFSFEAWVKIPTFTNSNQFLFDRGPTDSWRVYVVGAGDATDGRKLAFERTGTRVVSKHLNANTVYHVVCTYDGTTMRMYLDGELFEAEDNLTDAMTPAATIIPRIGANATASGTDPSLPLRGYIDEVAIYSGDLSPAQILRTYRAGGGGGGSMTPLMSRTRLRNGRPVVIPPASGSYPRIDRVVATRAHVGAAPRIALLRGSPTNGATLDNVAGAHPLPANTTLLSDVLVPVGAATGAALSLRDRRPWARGGNYRMVRTDNGYGGVDYLLPLTSGNVDLRGTAIRIECSGAPVRFFFSAGLDPTIPQARVVFTVQMDSKPILDFHWAASSGSYDVLQWTGIYTPPAGSHVFRIAADPWGSNVATDKVNIGARPSDPLIFSFEELTRPSGGNGF
jgi:hypothetical protein